VLAERPDGVAVIGWRPHPSVAQMCWATLTQPSMAVTNVYLRPRVRTAAVVGHRLALQRRATWPWL
jgi:hypothetical protein